MLNNRSITFALIVFLSLVYPYKIFAGTCGASHCTDSAPWTADSTSRADVAYCVNTCMSTGETLNVPAGSGQTWSSRITITADLDDITISGEGIGSTVITSYGFTVANGANNVTIQDMEWNSGTSIDVHYVGTSRNDTISNVIFNRIEVDGGDHWILLYGDITGVIANSVFRNCDASGIAWWFAHNTPWDEDTDLGTSDFLFVETNTFYASTMNINHAVFVNLRGGRIVARYNDFYEQNGYHFGDPFDVHGYGHDLTSDGGRAWEYYGNRFYRQSSACCRMLQLRGGTGVGWDNKTVSGTDFEHIPWLNEERAMDGIAATYAPNVWTSNPNCPDTDGHECRDYEEYPCCDQIGRGKDQALDPAYFWNNRDTGDSVAPVGVNNGSQYYGSSAYSVQDYIVENQDYYDEDTTNCPIDGASCTAGVGIGTRTQRPSNCTAGVAWFSTDQGGNWNTEVAGANDGCLDKCETTNNWTNGWYTPYTYPNPLLGETAPQLSSETIGPDGNTLTLIFDSNVTQGVGYNDSDWYVDCDNAGSSRSITYDSGDGTTTHVYTISADVRNDDTCYINFNGDTHSLENDGGTDLEAISDELMTNNSGEPPRQFHSFTISNGSIH